MLYLKGKHLSIDLGLNNLFIIDSGEKVDNPRHTKRYEKKLAGSGHLPRGVVRHPPKLPDCEDSVGLTSIRVIRDRMATEPASLKKKAWVPQPLEHGCPSRFLIP